MRDYCNKVTYLFRLLFLLLVMGMIQRWFHKKKTHALLCLVPSRQQSQYKTGYLPTHIMRAVRKFDFFAINIMYICEKILEVLLQQRLN